MATSPDRPVTQPVQTLNVNMPDRYPWKDEANVPQDITFTGNPGLKVTMASKKPVDFFQLFVSDELINSMVVETNRYAEQEINKQRPLRRSSRLKSWLPINREDMRQFLGILFHMGSVKLPSIEHYWSRDSLYSFPVFSKVMSRNKFQLMIRFWHFVDNEKVSCGRLNKIKPILDHLNSTMDEIYYPGKNLSIDESMMLWRGRLVFRQYIKNKRHKYGVKFYELCESDGVVLRAKIYSGESTPDIHSLGQTAAIVLELIGKFLGQGHCVYTDNFYNSFELAKHMT